MTTESITFLNDNRHHYDLLIRAQYVKHLDITTRQGLLKAAQEFSPGYIANLWCPNCMADLIKRVYGWYDKYLESSIVK